MTYPLPHAAVLLICHACHARTRRHLLASRRGPHTCNGHQCWPARLRPPLGSNRFVCQAAAAPL